MSNREIIDRAIDIVNELHHERLDYENEYVPLIDALQLLSELQEKIESGQAVILTEEEAKYYKEYKLLIKSTGSARNAFMYTMGATDEERKKQEALGFTIGAPIYVIIPGDKHIYEKLCRSVTIDKDGITINGVWSTNECFTTKEAAEEKLKELRDER